jgi:hypothetical protein
MQPFNISKSAWMRSITGYMLAKSEEDPQMFSTSATE